jgi:hypothetical protein
MKKEHYWILGGIIVLWFVHQHNQALATPAADGNP